MMRDSSAFDMAVGSPQGSSAVPNVVTNASFHTPAVAMMQLGHHATKGHGFGGQYSSSTAYRAAAIAAGSTSPLRAAEAGAPRAGERLAPELSLGTHSPIGEARTPVDAMAPSEPFHLFEPGGAASTGFNVCSATLGAGTLSFPSVMRDAGVVLGILMIAVAVLSCTYSIRLMLLISDRVPGGTSYVTLSRFLLGRVIGAVVAVVLILLMFLVAVLYVAFVQGQMSVILGMWPSFPVQGIWGSRLLTLFLWLAAMLPLSIPKEVNALRYASVAGVASVVAVVFAVCVHASLAPLSSTSPSAASTPPIPLFRWSVAGMYQLPTCAFAFLCHCNMFMIYYEMRPMPRSLPRMTKITTTSLTMCAALYAAIGIAGVAEFGDGTRDNILLNYPDPSAQWYIAAAFGAVGVTLTMAFPLCILPTRDAILELVGYTTLHASTSVQHVSGDGTAHPSAEAEPPSSGAAARRSAPADGGREPVVDASTSCSTRPSQAMEPIAAGAHQQGPLTAATPFGGRSDDDRLGLHPAAAVSPIRVAPRYVEIFLSVVLACLALILGLVMPTVRVLFGLLGGPIGGFIGFVLPGLFALRGGEWTVARVGLAHVAAVWTLIVGGVAIGAVGLAGAVSALS